jgi:hypothetical protein
MAQIKYQFKKKLLFGLVVIDHIVREYLEEKSEQQEVRIFKHLLSVTVGKRISYRLVISSEEKGQVILVDNGTRDFVPYGRVPRSR